MTDSAFAASFDNAARGLGALPVTGSARQSSSPGPAAIAVHYYSEVREHLVTLIAVHKKLKAIFGSLADKAIGSIKRRMIEWKISHVPVDYLEALRTMEERVSSISLGNSPELVWLLEHPPLYSAGTSAKPSGLVDPGRFPVYRAGRGGEYTYHGPGQRVAYVMLDLKKRQKKPDLRRYVQFLERWLIAALLRFGVNGETRDGRVGVWVQDKNGDDAKIAAIGVRIRRWVTYHGVSLNINPDLRHYSGIVPCGIRNYGITSLEELGIRASRAKVDKVLRSEFCATQGSL